MSRLAVVTKFLTTLELKMFRTTPDNRSALFDFVVEVAGISKSLTKLTLCDTESTAEQGDKLMTALADQSEFTTLQTLEISGESAWFKDNRMECITPLLALITRSSDLQKLIMQRNRLTDDQKATIRGAVTNDQCLIDFKYN